MLKKYTLETLEKTINALIKLDEQLPVNISSLKGKVLELQITPFNIQFFIQFKEGEIALLEYYPGSPDTVISSSPINLLHLSLTSTSKARSLFNEAIEISGDVELGQKVKQLLEGLDIDWEGHLAHWTGDVIAHQLGNWMRQGLQFTKRCASSMQQNITEYLQEELNALPSKNEIEDFFNDIDELVLHVERLQARIQQMSSS